MLDVPEDINSANQYRMAVNLICIASILDLCGEPFWVISQVYMYIMFRASVEFFYTLTRAMIMAVSVYLNPDSAMVFKMEQIFILQGQLLIQTAT